MFYGLCLSFYKFRFEFSMFDATIVLMHFIVIMFDEIIIVLSLFKMIYMPSKLIIGHFNSMCNLNMESYFISTMTLKVWIVIAIPRSVNYFVSFFLIS